MKKIILFVVDVHMNFVLNVEKFFMEEEEQMFVNVKVLIKIIFLQIIKN